MKKPLLLTINFGCSAMERPKNTLIPIASIQKAFNNLHGVMHSENPLPKYKFVKQAFLRADQGALKESFMHIQDYINELEYALKKDRCGALRCHRLFGQMNGLVIVEPSKFELEKERLKQLTEFRTNYLNILDTMKEKRHDDQKNFICKQLHRSNNNCKQ